MVLSFIAAVSENNAIGKNNTLPWHLPEDLKFFKRTTLGKPVIMGRKTFESLGSALPGRLNIVLSGNKDLAVPPGALLYGHINEAIDHLQNNKVQEAFIIGGGQLFQSAIDVIDRMYITRVHAVIPGADAFFPDIDHTHWKLVWEDAHPTDDTHKFAYTFQQYDRVEI